MKHPRPSLVLWSMLLCPAIALLNCAGELEDEDAFEEVKATVNPGIRDPAITMEPAGSSSGTAAANTAKTSAPAVSSAPMTSSAPMASTAAMPSTRPSTTPMTSTAPMMSTMPMSSGSAPMLPANCDALGLLQTSCSGCHAPGGVRSSDLRETAGIDGMLDVAAPGGACANQKIIDSANPQASLLVTKLKDTAACGVSMVGYATVALSDADIKCITDWTIAVAQGAR